MVDEEGDSMKVVYYSFSGNVSDLLVVLVLKIHLKLLKIIVTNQLMNPTF